MKQVIEVKNISKRYAIGARQSYGSLREEVMESFKSVFRKGPAADENSIWALQDVSFTVNEGEVLGIIGRNGAGKSTLLKVLSRITEPTEGTITMRGRVASLLEVGTGFHPELTGRENIFLNGALLGMTNKEIRSKFDEIVAFSEIEKFLDTPVKRYSSGMYVRLAFAVAAHLEPEILIIDEVLAVGDAAFQRKCLGKMGDVAKGGRTVLFVSHNMAAVESLCQRAVLLAGGKLIKDGKAEEVVSAYNRESIRRAEVELLNRPDRAGSGRIRLKSISVSPTKGRDAIRCGERIDIRVSLDSREEVSRYAVLFSIIDSMGMPIYWLDSRYELSLPEAVSSSSVIKCITNPINLIPGTYYINAALIVNGEVTDQVESAACFDVEADDFFGVGKLPSRQHGTCLLPQRWHAE
ncbi:MAG: ABC transporter ATP-binding protein [Deltaproteobacteria bacterium]|nr:ABC transporter ATP-binding protein [Deltaproteobacteria bacterium]